MNLIDTHCHLDMAAYQEDLPQVLDRAQQAGVTKVITVGIDLASSQQAIALATDHEMLYATVGFHPHEADRIPPEGYTALMASIYQHRDVVVALGEMGLDYVKQRSHPDNQIAQFSRQLDLAHELGLPVIIHNREADEKTYEILRQAKPLDHGGVMHCFSGDISFAYKMLDLNLHISIPGIVTFKNADTLHRVATRIPLEAMLVETDGPFLAPHPFRGKRNEPALVRYTAEKIAQLRNIPVEEVCQQTTENAMKLFKLNGKTSDDC